MLGLELHVLNASGERDFDAVFATLARLRAGALMIGPDRFFGSRTEQIAALALRHALRAIYVDRRFAAAGGLIPSRGAACPNLDRVESFTVPGTTMGLLD